MLLNSGYSPKRSKIAGFEGCRDAAKPTNKVL